MRVIALTGNIAAGKSMVAAVLKLLGARVIDADAIVRDLQRPGQPVFDALVTRFGSIIVKPSGELDRAALRVIMLDDPNARVDLEAIVHPAVARRQTELLTQAEAERVPVVIMDIPLLFEAGDPSAFDGIILVDAPIAVRRERLVKDRGLSEADADRMIASQMPSEAKRDRATWIIDNTGDREATVEQAHDVWHELTT